MHRCWYSMSTPTLHKNTGCVLFLSHKGTRPCLKFEQTMLTCGATLWYTHCTVWNRDQDQTEKPRYTWKRHGRPRGKSYLTVGTKGTVKAGEA